MLVTAVLAAGCTAAVEGTPTAQPSAPLPQRPREVRLDGVDPCSILTLEQRTALGFESEPRANKPYVELFRGEVPTCTMIGFKPDAIGLAIGTVTSTGIERWYETDLAVEVESTTVEGFPALIARPLRFTDYCSVEVNTASGQMLDVQLSDGGRQPPISQAVLCTRASRAAEELMKSLMRR
jgi:hypothetical protein